MSVPLGEVLSMVADLENHPDVAKVIMLNLAGSKAYGTSLPTSDTDIRGIFVAKESLIRTPFRKVTELNIPGAEDGKVYELSAFMELFLDMNPNILESLFTRDSEVLYATEEYHLLKEHAASFLNSNVAFRFSGYAMGQLKRIKGHDKWINNPQPVDMPSSKGFFRLVHNYSENDSLADVFRHERFMDAMDRLNDMCVLVPYGNHVYGVVENFETKGMFNKDGSIKFFAYQDLTDSDKKRKPLFIVRYLHEEHKQAKDNHSKYWSWVKNRNATRHELEEKFGYDTKHAMHLVRLLRMGEEILSTGQVNVFRPDASELLGIRNGSMTLEALLEYAEEKDQYIRGPLYKNTKLPKKSDLAKAGELIMAVQDMSWREWEMPKWAKQ